MPVAKWDPLRDLWTLQDHDNRLFQEGMARRSGQEEDLQAGQWAPAVDIFESAEKIVLRADLPGVEQDDIELRPEDLHRAERPHGTFVRSFSLPSNVDQSGIRASQKNGVLEVVLPKKQESR